MARLATKVLEEVITEKKITKVFRYPTSVEGYVRRKKHAEYYQQRGYRVAAVVIKEDVQEVSYVKHEVTRLFTQAAGAGDAVRPEEGKGV